MNKDLRKLELLQFVKAFLKKEYPLTLSKKFSKRWKKLEKFAKKENLNLNNISMKKYNLLWQKAKK